MRVVDEHGERRVRLEEVQQRDRRRHALAGIGRAGGEGAAERALGPVGDGAQERVQRRVGHVALSAHAGRAQRPHPAVGRLRRRVGEQRRPADAGLAAQEQRPAVLEQRADALPLVLATPHGRSLGPRGRCGGRPPAAPRPG
jgi:hypothetical protein